MQRYLKIITDKSKTEGGHDREDQLQRCHQVFYLVSNNLMLLPWVQQLQGLEFNLTLERINPNILHLVKSTLRSILENPELVLIKECPLGLQNQDRVTEQLLMLRINRIINVCLRRIHKVLASQPLTLVYQAVLTSTASYDRKNSEPLKTNS